MSSVRIALLLLLLAHGFRALAQSDPMDKLVSINAQRVLSIAGLSVPVSLMNIPVDISKPGDGILISRPKLNTLLADSTTAPFCGLIIQFLVAHELAHQIQFKHYRDEMAGAVSCELRRLYECQADILAGVYVSELYDLPDSVQADARLHPGVLHALEFVYSIGDEEQSESMHPSFSERRTAFRLGLAYPLERGREDSITWSLRMAKYIIHYPGKVTGNVLFSPVYWNANNDNTVRWDTSRLVHKVYYQLGSFKNVNPFPIDLFLQCKLVGQYRDVMQQDPKKILLQGSSTSQVFHLAPGDSVFVTGSLDWASVATEEFMPRFIAPPRPEALFSAQPSDGRAIPSDEGCPATGFGSRDTAALSEDLAIDLADALRESRHLFQGIETGMGKSSSDGSIEYDTYMHFFENALVWQYPSEHKASLYITLYDGKDSLAARDAFARGDSAWKQLRSSTGLSIEDDYWKRYDDGPDSSTDASIKRGQVYHIVGDDILVSIDHLHETWLLQGTDHKTGAEWRLTYERMPLPKNRTVRYSVDIIVDSPNP
ncbi:hypothetical protein [Dinghuibacter silviterrae]|uniref:Uncharacterized protein n=1 Tax=Dinghuibacter silviterrae TaxID=1539049 RepID=A0A4R8DQ09_9BACT|nr:hypothetical protein [Dinghuibacter silviterrae]TDX00202.1 hypothetical protein EDB95_1220 [Dinghuibacter silviterrae]